MSQPNWLGLLQWSLAYSDGTKASEHTAMSEEDKVWLEQVLREGVRDDPARMNELMMQLQTILERGPTDNDEEAIENALEEVKEIVEQIDMAQVFTKFGGVKCLMKIIHHESISNEMKAVAAAVIGTIAQNNIIVQDILFRDDVISELMRIFASSDSPLLCTKILYSVSCATRSHAAAETLFVQAFAPAAITKALASAYEPLILRAVFLSNALLTSDNTDIARVQVFVDLLLPALFAHISPDSLDLHENVLRLLTSLLHTTYGHQQLSGIHCSALEAALAMREQFLSVAVSNGSLLPEEAEHNSALISVLRTLLTQRVDVRYPHSAVSDGTASASTTSVPEANSDDAKKAAAVGDNSTSVLMLGPPSAETAVAPRTH